MFQNINKTVHQHYKRTLFASKIILTVYLINTFATITILRSSNSMSLTIEQFFERQRDMSTRICNSTDNLEKLGEADINRIVVEMRLELLTKCWNTFKTNHLKILSKKSLFAEKTDYFKSDYYGITEEGYLNSAAYMTTLLKKSTVKPSVSAPRQSPPTAKNLPTVDLDPYSGDPSDWFRFKDSFTAQVTNNDQLTKAEKFQLLKRHVYGKAASALEAIEVTDSNFEFAWNKLEDRFGNKLQLVLTFVAKLLTAPTVLSESFSELRLLHDITRDAVLNMRRLECPLDRWDDLLIYITASKLDVKTRNKWQVFASHPDNAATIDELCKFIRRRTRILKVFGTSLEKDANDPIQPQKRKVDICAFCEGVHFLLFCPEFKSKSAAERKEFVNCEGICSNCLGFHKFSHCQNLNRCRTCKKKHHSMLHESLDD